jgi:hypothetical protein
MTSIFIVIALIFPLAIQGLMTRSTILSRKLMISFNLHVSNYLDVEIASQLSISLASSEQRSEYLKAIVGFPNKTPWSQVKTILALSMNTKPEWTFGLYDTILENLVSGAYDVDAISDAKLCEDLNDILPNCLGELDIIAMDLMIATIREDAEEEEQDGNEVEIVPMLEPGLKRIFDKSSYLRDRYENKNIIPTTPLEIEVSAASDLDRRKSAFRALCLLRFVRVGIPNLAG